MFRNFTNFLSPITDGWKSANEEYNKVFHQDDPNKTNQDSLANIAVGVGAGLGVGVGIIALAPVIGVSVGGALGIGAVCLTTTAIGAGIGVAIGFIPQEAEKSQIMDSASQDRSPNSSRSQESAENAQPHTLNNLGGQIKENLEVLKNFSAGNGNTNASPEKSESIHGTPQPSGHSSGQSASSPQATGQDKPDGNHNTSTNINIAQKPDDTKNGPDNGVAGGISTQVLQAVDAGVSSSSQGPQQAPEADQRSKVSSAVEISNIPSTKIDDGTSSPQKSVPAESPKGPNNNPILLSSSPPPPPSNLVGGTDVPKPPSTSPANSATNTGASKPSTVASGSSLGQGH